MKKNVFLMAGILLLSLLLLPGLSGCRAVSSLIATPTPTATSTPTLTQTPTFTLTPTRIPTSTPTVTPTPNPYAFTLFEGKYILASAEKMTKYYSIGNTNEMGFKANEARFWVREPWKNTLLVVTAELEGQTTYGWDQAFKDDYYKGYQWLAEMFSNVSLNGEKYSLIEGYTHKDGENKGLFYISPGSGLLFGCSCPPLGTRISIRTLVFVFVIDNAETSFKFTTPDGKVIDLSPVLVQAP